MNLSIKMYTTSRCYDCRRAKQFLRVRQIPFEEIDMTQIPKRRNSLNARTVAAAKYPLSMLAAAFSTARPSTLSSWRMNWE